MRLLRILTISIQLLFVLSSVAMSDVGGEIELGYGHYGSEEGGVEESDMSHFAQRYALFWSNRGLFLGGRAGTYDLMLGGEWIALNSDVSLNGVDNNYNVSTGKLLYRGEISFAPGGLPFRFNAYARDNTLSAFQESVGFTSSWMDETVLSSKKTNLLSSNVFDDILDGQRFEIGGSAVLGIKNGSYLGRYRNVLSHLPKLYVDYRELRVRDLNSRTPDDYVERELAFVSLNKKHNWFHYRFFDHVDNRNPLLDFDIKTFILGTVNQSNRREWINLTNWIQLSVDASYTSEHHSQTVPYDENRYSLNLFSVTKRKNWTSSVFSRFWRWDQVDSLERYAEVPIYANGTLDRNNSWRFRFVGMTEKKNIPFAVVNAELDESTLYLKGLWEANKTQRFIFVPELEVEKKFGDFGEGWATRASIELYTNQNHKPVVNHFSKLSFSYFSTIPLGSVLETNLFEVSGRYNVDRRVSSRFRTGIESQLLVGFGQSSTDVTDFITPLSRVGFVAGSQSTNSIAIDGKAWRGRLLWFSDHVTISGFSNRYELLAEFQDDGTSDAGQYGARHRVRYQAAPYRFDSFSEVVVGDELSRSINSRSHGVILAGSPFDGFSLSNESNVAYSPNRMHKLSGRVLLDYRDQGLLGSGYRLGLQQDYRYTKFASYGVVRRLFEVNEFLDYEQINPEGNNTFESVALTCLANYYPVSWTRLGVKVRWQHDISAYSDDVGFGLYTNFNFSLLNIVLEYEYGMRTVDSAGVALDRTEQRWNISIKKTF